MPTLHATPWFHLAQFNIARAAAPLDSPAMAGFVDGLAGVNQAAEATPGFVWRLVDAIAAPPVYDDPAIVVNMSVWESLAALRDFAYRGTHLDVLRRRHEWFDPLPTPWQVLWWVPAGHVPTAEEGRDRLAFLAGHGSSAVAFGFGAPADPPPAPEGPVAIVDDVDLSGRRFVLEENAEGGDCRPGLTFDYEQTGGRVWARYDGGGVRFGNLSARLTPERGLDARYQHATDEGHVRTGLCATRIERLSDGRLRLRETWRWLSGAEGSGSSTLVEA